MREYGRPDGLDPERAIGADDPDTDEIRVEIQQTRSDMSGTIDAIQQRLAPDVLTEQAKDVARDAADQAKQAAQAVIEQTVREVKDAALQVTEHAVHEVKEAAREVTVEAKDAAWDATIGRAEEAVSDAGQTAKGVGSMVIDTIKQHPVPAALAGLSLFWLYRNRTSDQAPRGESYRAGSYQAYPARATYEGSWSDGRRTLPESGSQGTVGAITETVGEAAGRVGEVAGDVASSVASGATSAASSVASGATYAASSAGQLASTAGGTAVDVGSDLIGLVRQNPIPAALVGVGLGWLYMNRSSGGPDARAHSGDHYRYGPEAASPYWASGSETSDGSGEGIGSLARQAGDRAADLASGVGEQAGDLAGAVMDQTSEIAGAVKDRTMRAPGQLGRMMEGSPFVTAALAATLGGAVGLALPSTQPEDRLMGAARDRAMGQAETATSKALDKVQNVAQEVKTTVTKEAQSQGLTV